MKIALVHDYIKEYGGAEKVLEALHELYPEAPVYTSVYLPQFLGPHKNRFADWDIRTSYLQNFPLKANLISPFRLLSKSIFQSFDFTGYDVIIISATGAYIPNFIDKKSAKLICYCHTPPRYLYGYATARSFRKNVLMRGLIHLASHILRMQDFTASKNVDQYIANSEEVKQRIWKFYRKEAIVVYPPVDQYLESSILNLEDKKKNSRYQILNSRYYLAGGRLARPKHIDLIIKACMELGLQLKVFGKGFAGYGEELHELVSSYRHPELASGSSLKDEKMPKPSFTQGFGRAKQVRHDNSVEFLGEVTEEEKWKLYTGAKALLFASVDEDFGIMPVESMSMGTPVIAYKSGGVQETVIDRETGLFYDELTTESLTNAIKKFERMKFDSRACQKQAKKFSKERFMKEIRRVVGYV